jgi:ankyrin repeat protein
MRATLAGLLGLLIAGMAVGAATAAGTDEVDGTTTLHWAVQRDDADTVAQLLRRGAKSNAANRYGVTPLMLAAENGNPRIAIALLQAGADANGQLPSGETVLMTAARTGSEDVVKALLQHGADPNIAERTQGETALMWAVAENHPRAARALIEGGARVNARSAPSSLPPLNFGTSGIVPMALPKGQFTPLMYAARQGAIDSARVLLDAGADLNLTDPEGTTALELAIINSHYELAAFLLDRGADPEIADASGMGALYAAVDMHSLTWMQGRPAPKTTDRLSSLDVITRILDWGADPNRALTSPLLLRHHAMGDPVLAAGATPLMRSAKTGDVIVMRLLLDYGADPAAVQKNGTTMLMVAAGLGWRDGGGALPVFDRGSEPDAIDIMTMCLARGGDVNAVNEAGDTALHGAAVRGADSLITFLVAHGAKVDAKNQQGRTPLDIAVRRQDRSPSTVALLKTLSER